ncbi:MAG: ABC transporter permease [Erysipelotrichaceae bacterium]|nr:ABC transporter permease [Erysipelotrichaceae bacterium]
MKSFRELSYPYIVWACVMIGIPMILIILYAFTQSGNSVTTFTFTIENFLDFFNDSVFIQVLMQSLKIALITTVLCILIGYPAAFFVSRMEGRMKATIFLLLTMPMWINMLVRTYSWISILSDSGLINTILGYLGIGPIQLLYTDFSVSLGMVYNFLPFMIISIFNSLDKMDKGLLEASADLGANKVQTFLRVMLPLSLPGVITGITLVFLPAVSSFVIPKLLGGGQYVLIGNLIETQFISVGEWHFGSAISLVMTIIIMISMYLTKRVDKQSASDSVASGGGRIW